MKKRLLILADDDDLLATLQQYFAGRGLDLLLERDFTTARQRVEIDHPHVVLLDISLPEHSGLDLLRSIKEIDPRVSVIVMTGFLTTQNAIEAMKKGAYDYLTKPVDFNHLEIVVNKAFQNSFLTREIRFVEGAAAAMADEAETDFMIGSSPEMVEIWKMVGKIAHTDATVLIQGESGTGKELLARSIYANSRRELRPFLAVNCAALPENLLESELFGHEKGAFTDAFRRHVGRFEQCNGGTIFLDEIGEMSPKNQAKLLRVLENQEFERIGGNETIKVDVRIIAATNRSLVAAVKEKRFRLDLLYRLRIVTFFLPPLRERPEDIPDIARHFVARYARQCRKPPMQISPAAMKILTACPWTGNIRELKNAIHSAVVFSRGNTLFPDDFSSLLHEETLVTENVPRSQLRDAASLYQELFAVVSGGNDGHVYSNYIEAAEKALILNTMEKFKGNQVQAARFLGISRNTLRDRLLRYNI